MKSSEAIVQRSWELLTPIIEANGFELVEVEFVMERGSWVLRLYVDKEGGVNLEDCASLSEEIGHLLDVEDYIDRSYLLEVSSPGLNRPLRKPKDFERYSGNKVKVVMKEAVGGRKNFKGILIGIQGDMVTIESSGQRFTFDIKDVKKANILYDFKREETGLKC
jgi:ribosome maturation factor RimP